MGEQTIRQEAVLSARYRERQIHFSDFVREGEVVEVFRTEEDAERERGPFIPCIVRRHGDDWWLEERSVQPAAAEGQGQ